MNRVEHLLFMVSEECDEIGQRASKAARFGLTEIQPEQPLTNAERLVYEYADLLAVVEMLCEATPEIIEIDTVLLRQRIDAKKAKVEKYLSYSAYCGTLTEGAA